MPPVLVSEGRARAMKAAIRQEGASIGTSKRRDQSGSREINLEYKTGIETLILPPQITTQFTAGQLNPHHLTLFL